MKCSEILHSIAPIPDRTTSSGCIPIAAKLCFKRAQGGFYRT